MAVLGQYDGLVEGVEVGEEFKDVGQGRGGHWGEKLLDVYYQEGCFGG